VKRLFLTKSNQERLLITISTNGEIKTWDIGYLIKTLTTLKSSQDLEDKFLPLGTVSTGQRLICIDGKSFKDGNT